jgi:hypothetical protein
MVTVVVSVKMLLVEQLMRLLDEISHLWRKQQGLALPCPHHYYYNPRWCCVAVKAALKNWSLRFFLFVS